MQVLRLVATFSMAEVSAAVRDTLRIPAISFDAVKHLLLCAIEHRVPKLDLENYPHLPAAKVALSGPHYAPTQVLSNFPRSDQRRLLSQSISWFEVGSEACEVGADVTERAARERVIKQHQTQYERLEARIETLYTDRLDGRISPAFYDAKAGEIRAQQQAILRKIEQIRSSEPAPVETALDLMRLTSRAAELFRQQPGHEQRRLLRTFVKTASWQEGELRLEFEQPFDILRGSNRASITKEMQIAGSGRDSGIWLPGNRDFQQPLHLCSTT